MHELVQRTIGRRFKQSAGKESKDVHGRGLACNSGHENPAASGKTRSLVKNFEGAATALDCLPLGASPGAIHVVGLDNVLRGSGFPDFHAVLFGKPDITATVLWKLLEQGVRALGQVEDDISLHLAAAETACGKCRQRQMDPCVNGDQLRPACLSQ